MFGIESTEIFLLMRLLGLGVAGAAAFWGLVFLFIASKTQKQEEVILWKITAQKLLLLFFPSILVYAIGWSIVAVKQCAFCVRAHEGISIAQKASELSLSIQAQYPFFVLLIAIGVISFGMFLFAHTFLFHHLFWIYCVSFLLASILLFHSWGTFDSLRQSISFGLHNWHAILTIASVVVSDFLYMMLRTQIQPLFGRIFAMITLGIWVGLGLDFLSSGLIFDEEFVATDKFLFSQTLIGILIINGVILSGPMARALLAAGSRVPLKLNMIMGFLGSISIVGWLGNGALDTFRSLTLSYWELFGFYALFVIIAFLGHELIERLYFRPRGI